MVDAVFFDLFETLITEWENDEKVADFGSPAEALGLNEDVFNREWTARRERRMNGYFADYVAVLRDICETVGQSINDDILNALNDQRRVAKLAPFNRIRIDVIRMLNELKLREVKVGLISNCSSEEVEGLMSSPFGHVFDDIVLSFEVGVYKPNREMYLLACERLNVEPTNSLFIGDGGSNELVGARDAGMKAYHATWFQPPFISERIKGFSKLTCPQTVIDLLN